MNKLHDQVKICQDCKVYYHSVLVEKNKGPWFVCSRCAVKYGLKPVSKEPFKFEII
jgi:hypothetical protein